MMHGHDRNRILFLDREIKTSQCIECGKQIVRAYRNVDSVAIVFGGRRAAILIEVIVARAAVLALRKIYLSSKGKQRCWIYIRCHLIANRDDCPVNGLRGYRKHEPVTIEKSAATLQRKINRTHGLITAAQIHLIIELLADFERKIEN